MHCVGIGNGIENAQSTIIRSRLSFNFSYQKVISLKTVVHVSFAVKGLFPTGLEPMLCVFKDKLVKYLPPKREVSGSNLTFSIVIFHLSCSAGATSY